MREETHSLEALLRYRVAVERMQWLKVQSAHLEVDKAERELDQLERLRVEAKLEMLKAMQRGVECRTLEMYSTASMERKMAEQQELKAELFSRFQNERECYLERRRERETVENALTRVRAEIEKEKQRREQMRIDDDTLQRMSRGERKSPFVL